MNHASPAIIDATLVLEVFLGIFLLSHVFSLKKIRFCRTLIGSYCLLYASVMLIQQHWITTLVADTYPVYVCLHIFIMFLFELLFCDGKIIFKIFLPLVYVSMITLSGFPLVLLGNCLGIGHLLPPGMMNNILKLASKFLLIFFTLYMLHFKMDTSGSYPSSYYLTMIVTPVLNMLAISLLKKYYYVFPYVDIVGCFTLLLELLIYYMIWQSTKVYAKNIQLQLMQQQQKYQKQHMKELRDIVKDYHQLRHDMKNHITCMDRLLSQEKYQALKEYFYSLSKDLYALDDQIETGNEIVNQVINIKYSTANHLNIPMEIQAAVPGHLEIPDYLLCSVLANLLDNAIESSARIEHPSIFVKIHMVKGYLSITVQNHLEEWQYENALNHKTTKSDPGLHGLGHRIVEDIVQRYNGISTFEIRNEDYVASIMLELLH